jgi:hypothetical protein
VSVIKTSQEGRSLCFTGGCSWIQKLSVIAAAAAAAAAAAPWQESPQPSPAVRGALQHCGQECPTGSSWPDVDLDQEPQWQQQQQQQPTVQQLTSWQPAQDAVGPLVPLPGRPAWAQLAGGPAALAPR